MEPWKGCNVTIPVFFKTAHENFEVRQILRKYFLKEEYQNQTLGQYFVVGMSKDLNSEKFQKIKDEALKYDDIIIGNHFYIERFFGIFWKQNPIILLPTRRLGVLDFVSRDRPSPKMFEKFFEAILLKIIIR